MGSVDDEEASGCEVGEADESCARKGAGGAAPSVSNEKPDLPVRLDVEVSFVRMLGSGSSAGIFCS